MKKKILIIILLAAETLTLHSQQVFNYDSLSTFRILQSGLEANYNIKLKRQIVGESQGQMTSAKGIFNPQLSVDAYGFYGQDPTMTFQDSYSLKAQLLVPTRLGLKFYTGFKLSNEIFIVTGAPGIFPSQYLLINESGVWAGVTMPLMRDLGRNNSNNVAFIASRLMNKAQNVSFTDEVCQFIKNTLTNYYEAYQRVKVFRILRDADKDARQYCADIGIMIDDEQLAKAELYRATAYQLNIAQQFSLSRNEIVNSIYDLVTSIGMNVKISPDTLPVFLDSLPDPASFPWNQYAAYVFKNVDSMVVSTPYYKSLDLATSSTRIAMEGARYNKLNELDLDFRFMYFGSTVGLPISEFNQAFPSGVPGSSLNLTLAYKIPFKNEERKGDYLTKLSSYEFSKTQLEKMKFESIANVYKLLSDLGSLIPLYKNQIELATVEKETYLNEVQKFKMGSSTQINMINTYMDYNTALLNVESGRLAIMGRVITLKYLIGDFPTSTDQLIKYNPWMFDIQ